MEPPLPKTPPRPLLGWGTLGLAALAGGATWWLAQNPEWTEQHFSQAWYPRVRRWQHRLVQGVPFSIAEPLAALILAGILVQAWVGVVRGPSLLRRLCAPLTVLVRSAVGLYVVYLVLWGGHQYRLSLDQRLGWSAKAATPADLVALGESVVAQLAEDRRRIAGDEGFRQDLLGTRPRRIQAALELLAEEFPEFRGEAPVIRTFGNSDLWAQLGIAGLYVPFTGESHIHGEGPATRWPFSALHESMHQRGYAREDEANFLAWWAAQRSQDPYLRYSANLVAWTYLRQPLLLADAEAYLRLEQAIPEAVLADSLERRRFWQRHESPLRQVGERSNDLFLKSQGQHAGVMAYGQMVRWMLVVGPQDP